MASLACSFTVESRTFMLPPRGMVEVVALAWDCESVGEDGHSPAFRAVISHALQESNAPNLHTILSRILMQPIVVTDDFSAVAVARNNTAVVPNEPLENSQSIVVSKQLAASRNLLAATD
ncbi:hypothetical protein CDL15_Pgr016068 [Punica granatum]|nr:hypothetical protein CDL15_Pgr016068 [Punica granatum]